LFHTFSGGFSWSLDSFSLKKSNKSGMLLWFGSDANANILWFSEGFSIFLWRVSIAICWC
jgi:hypothetical protein